MKVSVVIPLYNARDVIAETVTSVLAQTWKNYELIVVDDGSTDGSSEMVMKFKDNLRYVKQENAGVAKARNRGIAESVGESVALLDHDDLWHPTKLEKQVRMLDAHPEIGMVITDVAHLDQYGTPNGIVGSAYNPMDEFAKLFLQGFIPTPSSAMIRQSVFNSVGVFDEEFHSAGLDDHEMWARIAAHCKISNIQEPLTYHRNRDDKPVQVELEHRPVLLSKLNERFGNDPERRSYLMRQRACYLAALGKWLLSKGKIREGRSSLFEGLLLSIRQVRSLSTAWRCLLRIVRSFG